MLSNSVCNFSNFKLQVSYFVNLPSRLALHFSLLTSVHLFLNNLMWSKYMLGKSPKSVFRVSVVKTCLEFNNRCLYYTFQFSYINYMLYSILSQTGSMS